MSATVDPSALTNLMLSVGYARRRLALPVSARAVVRVCPADADRARVTFAACYPSGTLEELLGGPLVADPALGASDVEVDPVAPTAAAPGSSAAMRAAA